VKVGIGSEAGTYDLRRRRVLKSGLSVQKAGGALIGRWIESQDRAEGVAMNQALARVPAGPETERVEV
jgi:hypothetical protein